MTLSLPPQPNVLLGRDAELAEVRRMVVEQRMRLLTLTGAGGSGKTRLALALAASVADAFADGVRFIDLTVVPASDPDLVWHVVVDALDVQGASGSALDKLSTALESRQVLLVLDNFEHVLGAARHLAPLFERHADFQVVVTSREPLRLRWERTYDVPPLALPSAMDEPTARQVRSAPAVALFVQRAQAVQPRFVLDDGNAGAVAQLCARLDGLPLAIELAAARTRVLTPQALLAHLDRQPSLLASGARDAPARHRTLQATIAWSYDLLDTDEQAIFRHLGLFPGGCTAEAAAAVCAPLLQVADEAEALDRLSTLTDKSLLRAQAGPDAEPRFGMLETLREFALVQLRKHGEEPAALERLSRFYLDLAQRAEMEVPGPHEIAWLNRLEADYPNLRSVAHAALESGALALVLRLTVALGPFWRYRGHMDEALHWLNEALARVDDNVDAELRARALVLASRFAWSMGDHTAAQQRLQASVQLWRTLANPRGLAEALNELGLQAGDSGNAAQARAALEESLALYRDIRDAPGTVQTLHSLGFRAEERGELDEAAALLTEALELRRALGHPSGTARTLNGLGIVARGHGLLDRAEEWHRESLQLYRGLGHTLGAAYALAYLGRVAAARGDTLKAAALALESIELAAQLRNPWVMALGVGTLGILAANHERGAQAARLLAATENLLGGALPSSSTERREHEAAKARARALLGAEFETAWGAGLELTHEALVQEAQSFEVAGREQARRATAAEAEPLSARELEVARLIARGMTNRQIADELVISKWTADNHVARILKKLELATRAQVTSWLARRGLL